MKFKSHVLLIGTLPLSLINFRGELIKDIKSRRLMVTAMASSATKKEREQISEITDSYCDYPVSRSGLNPIQDLRTLFFFVRYFLRSDHNIILAYTIKPIVWGGIAARLTGQNNFYALVTGLGFAFQSGSFSKNILKKLVSSLYKISLKHASGVIFQNPDNLQSFVELGIVPSSKCYLVNGSGVNLSRFKKGPLTSAPKFLLIARLLGDKGIREYVSAARLVRTYYPDASFDLVGPLDPSPDGIRGEEVSGWVKEGVINYHGEAKDVRPFLLNCNIFVLPSYHEGLPRTVLEAMALGRPVITTNVPGCKETVIDGLNGWLVKKGDHVDLANRMIWFLENPREWKKMADRGRIMAEEKYDVNSINEDICRIIGLNE